MLSPNDLVLIRLYFSAQEIVLVIFSVLQELLIEINCGPREHEGQQYRKHHNGGDCSRIERAF